jgi:hypothetical protein
MSITLYDLKPRTWKGKILRSKWIPEEFLIVSDVTFCWVTLVDSIIESKIRFIWNYQTVRKHFELYVPKVQG